MAKYLCMRRSYLPGFGVVTPNTVLELDEVAAGNPVVRAHFRPARRVVTEEPVSNMRRHLTHQLDKLGVAYKPEATEEELTALLDARLAPLTRRPGAPEKVAELGLEPEPESKCKGK